MRAIVLMMIASALLLAPVASAGGNAANVRKCDVLWEDRWIDCEGNVPTGSVGGLPAYLWFGATSSPECGVLVLDPEVALSGPAVGCWFSAALLAGNLTAPVPDPAPLVNGD